LVHPGRPALRRYLSPSLSSGRRRKEEEKGRIRICEATKRNYKLRALRINPNYEHAKRLKERLEKALKQ